MCNRRTPFCRSYDFIRRGGNDLEPFAAWAQFTFGQGPRCRKKLWQRPQYLSFSSSSFFPPHLLSLSFSPSFCHRLNHQQWRPLLLLPQILLIPPPSSPPLSPPSATCCPTRPSSSATSPPYLATRWRCWRRYILSDGNGSHFLPSHKSFFVASILYLC